MNWTAILALLSVNGFLGFLLWCAERRATLAREDAREAQKRAHTVEMHSLDIAIELEEARTLHRNLLNRRSRRSDPAQGIRETTNAE
jgi:hypothetical protein